MSPTPVVLIMRPHKEIFRYSTRGLQGCHRSNEPYGIRLYSLLIRLGLIAEHGYWVKPAAAHRVHSSRDRASTGWDEPAVSAYADTEEWGGEPSGGLHQRSGSFGDSRGSETSTPVGLHPPARYRSHGHGRARQFSGTGPPSPDGSPLPQMSDGTRDTAVASEWIRRSHNADLSWRSEVLAILQNFTSRTPGSFLELKDR